MYIVSSCLLGMNCKYNGKSNESNKVKGFLRGKEYIAVCPEQMGGLPTPRARCEIIKGRVITEFNEDVTDNFKNGASEVLKIVRLYGCTEAILQDRSPSCGVNEIYDGTFAEKKIKGMGMTAKALKKEGLILMTENDL